MTDQEIQRGARVKLGRVEGGLRVRSGATIDSSEEGKAVIVSEGAYFEGTAEINCNFECDSLRVEHGGTLKVNGNLTVHGLLDVMHSINSSGTIRAEEIDVGGRIFASAIHCEGRARVGGTLDVENTLEAKSVEVGGRARSLGTVRLQDLNVGGVADVGGGSISGQIRVGGRFSASSRLEFGDMQVLGRISLPPGCRARRVSTYGKLSAAGDLDCDELEVQGLMEVRGNCKTQKIDVMGKLVVEGLLESSGDLDTAGTTEIGCEFRGANLRVAGRFKAQRAIASNELELGGHCETREGMKGNAVVVHSGSRCRGALVGSRVDIRRSYDVAVPNWSKGWAGQIAQMRLIGRETRVEDIYAKEVHLGRAVRCAKIFAEVVEFEEGCIAEKVEYTRELRGPVKSAYFQIPPEKVAKLPNPPI